MSAYIQPVIKFAAKLASPSFYRQAYWSNVASVREEMKKESIRPLFTAIALVGSVGYAMEYFPRGRYHVADKKAIIDKA
jgi:hypothetical protein